MSRFSGLPEPRRDSDPENGTRIARIRAVARGETPSGRLGSTRQSAAQATATAAKAAASIAPKPAASATPPRPARKLERTEVVALAFRNDPKIQGMQDIALHMLDDPDMKGLSGEAVVRCLTGIDANKYRAAMAEEERKARVARADAVWDRARASIDGNRPTAAADRKPAAGAKSGSVDDIWTRAYAAAAR